jgi:hypothetical protein
MLRSQSNQTTAEKRAFTQIKWFLGFRAYDLYRFRVPVTFDRFAQVMNRNVGIDIWQDDLSALSIHGVENGTQGGVPQNDGLQSSLEHTDVERPHNAERPGEVIRSRSWLKLIQKPQSLLTKGWDKTRVRHAGTQLYLKKYSSKPKAPAIQQKVYGNAEFNSTI